MNIVFYPYRKYTYTEFTEIDLGKIGFKICLFFQIGITENTDSTEFHPC